MEVSVKFDQNSSLIIENYIKEQLTNESSILGHEKSHHKSSKIKISKQYKNKQQIILTPSLRQSIPKIESAEEIQNNKESIGSTQMSSVNSNVATTISSVQTNEEISYKNEKVLKSILKKPKNSSQQQSSQASSKKGSLLRKSTNLKSFYENEKELMARIDDKMSVVTQGSNSQKSVKIKKKIQLNEVECWKKRNQFLLEHDYDSWDERKFQMFMQKYQKEINQESLNINTNCGVCSLKSGCTIM